MRIGIVGAGAIGCLFGSFLAKAGNEVTLVHRRRSVVQTIRESGIILHNRSGETSRVRVHADLSPADLSMAELVIFTVKSFHTAQAAKVHKDKLGRRSIVLTLQNGLGNVESLSKLLTNNRVLGGATTEASLLIEKGEIVHAGKGSTWVGELDNSVSTRCGRIVGKIREAGFDTRVSSNILGVIWAKAIVNSAINPVSALTGLRNGELLRSKDLSKSMSSIVNEGVTVGKAEGIRLNPPKPLTLLHRVLNATASNKSSMLQDLARKRRTEVRQLNGAILRLGGKHNIRTPLNQLLTSLILAAESSRTHHDA